MKFLYAAIACVICFACKQSKPAPDVSNIKIDVQLKRFDRDLFAIDTNNIQASLNKLQQQYGSFLNDYLYNIMVLTPEPDTIVQKLKLFVHDYRFMYDTAQKNFGDFNKEFDKIKNGLQYVKY